MIRHKYSPTLTLNLACLEDYPEYASGSENFRHGTRMGLSDIRLYGESKAREIYTGDSDFCKGHRYGMDVVYPEERVESEERWKKIQRDNAKNRKD